MVKVVRIEQIPLFILIYSENLTRTLNFIGILHPPLITPSHYESSKIPILQYTVVFIIIMLCAISSISIRPKSSKPKQEQEKTVTGQNKSGQKIRRQKCQANKDPAKEVSGPKSIRPKKYQAQKSNRLKKYQAKKLSGQKSTRPKSIRPKKYQAKKVSGQKSIRTKKYQAKKVSGLKYHANKRVVCGTMGVRSGAEKNILAKASTYISCFSCGLHLLRERADVEESIDFGNGRNCFSCGLSVVRLVRDRAVVEENFLPEAGISAVLSVACMWYVIGL